MPAFIYFLAFMWRLFTHLPLLKLRFVKYNQNVKPYLREEWNNSVLPPRYGWFIAQRRIRKAEILWTIHPLLFCPLFCTGKDVFNTLNVKWCSSDFREGICWSQMEQRHIASQGQKGTADRFYIYSYRWIYRVCNHAKVWVINKFWMLGNWCSSPLGLR